MSELIVVSFDTKYRADEALLNLLKQEQAHLSDLEDAVVITKNAEGKIRVKAYHDLVQPLPELSNELWGGVVSGVVFHRSLQVSHEVFDSKFLTTVEDSLQPNTSALMVLVRTDVVDRVVNELSMLEGKLSRTTLPEANQKKLQKQLN